MICSFHPSAIRTQLAWYHAAHLAHFAGYDGEDGIADGLSLLGQDWAEEILFIDWEAKDVETESSACWS